VRRAIYGASSGIPHIDYITEAMDTTITTNDTVWDDGPYPFHPYFRYRIFARYANGYDRVNSELTLEIGTPDGSFATMTDANGGRACEQSGCADMSLSREVWSCRPNPPSPTISPMASPSHSPSGTASTTPLPSPEFSPFPHSRRGIILRTHIFHFMVMSMSSAHL
jgi:hypothetical protein